VAIFKIKGAVFSFFKTIRNTDLHKVREKKQTFKYRSETMMNKELQGFFAEQIPAGGGSYLNTNPVTYFSAIMPL
jgi:hypothetical protein